VNCDDFGRFDGRVKVLAARLFPLKDITREQMQDALDSLIAADLVTIEDGYGKPVVCMKTWSKHQRTRANETKYPIVADTCGQMTADVSEPQKTADKCARIRNRNTLFDIRNSESLIEDDEAHEIQSEQNRVLDAAEDAGFDKSNSVRAGLLKLYEEHGIDKVLHGIESCVEHGAPNLAYLKACMTDKPKPTKKSTKVLPAQDFPQRDYTDVNGQLMNELAEEIAAFKKGAG
jgi:hypothetical protein